MVSDEFSIMDTTLTTQAVLDNNPKRLKSFNFSFYEPYRVRKNTDVKATNKELSEEGKGNCLQT